MLFTTGYARNAIVHDGRLDPGVVLIPKPFTYAAVAAKLADMLDEPAGPPRILLVEDEVLVRMVATDQLEDLGYRVETAGSATEAMNKVKLMEGDLALAIVDIGLPDIKGDVLVGELRARHPDSPHPRGERLRRSRPASAFRRRRARHLHPQALHTGRSQAGHAASARQVKSVHPLVTLPAMFSTSVQKNSSPH